MSAAPLPSNEKSRIEDLLGYNILDTSEEKAFNEIVELASFICKTPISLVSLVDDKRQWFKAKIGLEAKQTPREHSFCAHTILDNGLFEIEDATKDERFISNPLVTGNPNIRFYAGIPLVSSNGNNLGSLCVIDDKPNKLDLEQRSALKKLANRVINEMELRKHLKISKEQNAELEKNNSFKNKLFSIISHDLRAPLNSIISTVSMFDSDLLTEKEIKEVMNELKIEANTTSQLLDNLLHWAKAKFDNQIASAHAFKIAPIITETLELYQGEANRKKIQIQVDVDKKLKVYGDPEMIKMVIRNLINNAIKYCKKDDSLLVKAYAKNGKSIVIIEDTGIGMSGLKLDEILEGKTMKSNPGTSREKGVGLGLVLINEFIKLNNGKIMGSSEPGNGTTFRIEFLNSCPA